MKMSDLVATNKLEQLTQKLLKDHWDFSPTAGSRIGLHQYDGRLPELSPNRVRARIGQIRRSLGQLSGISTEQLSKDQLLSYRLLDLLLKRELFNLDEWRTLETNPMKQVGFLNVSGYVRRDYAPLFDRIKIAIDVLNQVPEFLEILRTTLHPNIGRPVLEMSIESYRGMARFYRVDLSKIKIDCSDKEIIRLFDQARETAADAVIKFVDFLQSMLDDDTPRDFAIGSNLYSGMLSSGEGITIPLAELSTLGQANLEQNLEQLAVASESVFPGKSIKETVSEIGRRHPSAERLIPETQDMLDSIRKSLVDLDLISVPSSDRCQVVETPTFMRYAFAAMDSPGSLEKQATESFYYVTPVEDDWSQSQCEEWLSNFNYDTLRVISIHEVYPGHFVHHLHNRYGGELPLVNRVVTSYAFTEGWAHYTEQMMLETKYGDNEKSLLVTQLLEALVRNCRYLCSIRMHTQGMTVDEATRFFMDNAYMEELPARREALRGTFDPGYLNYTLGKLMILKLRSDYRKEHGSSYTLKRFHDELLSHGAPALPFLRDVMLYDNGNIL